MHTIEDQLRRYLAQSGVVAECDIAATSAEFFKLVEQPSLNLKVSAAMKLRDQGHFAQAMLKMSEVNREQVIAIREIQRVLDTIHGVQGKEVAFAKYRQFYPFEIGIEGGDEVLTLLNLIANDQSANHQAIKAEIHTLEQEREDENEHSIFLKQRFGSDAAGELMAIQEKIQVLSMTINDLKESILHTIFGVVDETLNKMAASDGIDKFTELSWNLFYVFLSPIATKHADSVEIEN